MGVPARMIRPVRGFDGMDLREVWQYRELLYFFVWREVKVRYQQTVLGVLWAVIQPVMLMVVFTVFFGRFVKVPTDSIPYPLFSYAALLPWTLFAEGVGRCANSVVNDSNLVRKVYFPRCIMPFSGAVTPLVDFFFSFAVFAGMMLWFGVIPTWRLLWLPVFMALAVITALAVGLWLAAFNVQYRDVRYVVPFLLQVWFFGSPVVYSTASLPKAWYVWYSLNPMTGVIEGFRWVLLGSAPPSAITTGSLVTVLVLLVSGALYFRRTETSFADIV